MDIDDKVISNTAIISGDIELEEIQDENVIKKEVFNSIDILGGDYDTNEALDILVTNAYEMGVSESVLGLQGISLYSDVEDEENMQNQAPFSLIGKNDFNISVSSGTVTYDQNLVSIKGPYGLDINVSYNYNSAMPLITDKDGSANTKHYLGGFRINIPRLSKRNLYTNGMEAHASGSIMNPNYIFLDDGYGYEAQYDGRSTVTQGNIGTLDGKFKDVGWLKDLDRVGNSECPINDELYESWHMVKYQNGNVDYFDRSGKIFKRVNRYNQTNWYIYKDKVLTIYGAAGAKVEVTFVNNLYSEISNIKAYGYNSLDAYKTINFTYESYGDTLYPLVYRKIIKTESGTGINTQLTTVFNMDVKNYNYDRSASPTYKYFCNLKQVDYPTGASSCVDYVGKVMNDRYPNSYWPVKSYYKLTSDTNGINKKNSNRL